MPEVEETTTINMDEVMSALHGLGAHVSINCAKNGKVDGFACEISYVPEGLPKGDADEPSMEEGPSGLIKMLMGPQTEYDASNPDHGHGMLIKTWAETVTKAVERGNLMFLAAYEASIKFAGENLPPAPPEPVEEKAEEEDTTPPPPSGDFFGDL